MKTASMKIRIAGLFFLLIAVSCEPDNLAPNSIFLCTPAQGNIKTLFDLDASASIDPDGLKSLLVFRWDYDDDGEWDTPFGPYKISSCHFSLPGSYNIRLEVKDTYDAISSSIFTVNVDSLHHITDPRDGQVYPVVKLGTHWWMARNLNIGKTLNPGDLQTNNSVIEKFIYPAEDPENLNGGLYTWDEMMGYVNPEGIQGICPPGWNLPTDADWRNMLTAFHASGTIHNLVYEITGQKFVPDQQVTHDNYKTEGAVWRLLRETGSTGFDAVPAGYLNPDGVFGTSDYYFPGKTATFWTSSMYSDYSIRVRLYRTDNHEGDIFRFADNRNFAFSVRCVRATL